MSKILLIDDEKNIRLMVGTALQHLGHVVESAADGTQGLEKFGDGTGWDLTLLDQRMPGAQGLDVLRELRRRSPQARVIMVTAFGTVDLAVEAMKLGATDFLRKPFSVEVLRGAVAAALREGAPTVGHGVTYALTTLNGFRIESRPEGQTMGGQGVENVFVVHAPDNTSTEVVVSLSDSFIGAVQAHLDASGAPPVERFWHALSEEALANYLWQNAAPPRVGTLCVDAFPEHLRRWVAEVAGTSQKI